MFLVQCVNEIKMLHDLLCALSGNSGSFFKESFGKLEVACGLSHISPNEETALNHLLVLGSNYMLFQKFIDTYSSLLPNVPSNFDDLKQGCYLKAFCLGLDNVLSSYRKSLLKIEKEIIADPNLSLLYVQQETENYHSLFAALVDVITTLKARKSHGCQILSILHRSSSSGNPLVREAMLNIMSNCHIVMYKQLLSWLLYGLLIDRYNEFFITKISSDSLDKTSNNLPSISQARHIDDFEVKLVNLPSYIPNRIARVICFIGSSLQLFQCEDSTQNNSADPDYKLKGILQQAEKEFIKELQALQQAKEFVLEDFEMCIDKIRRVVAKELWKLCVEQGQLVSYFNMVKDFFLLGRGELFLVFIDEANSLLRNPPSRVTQHDVQQIFLRSAAKIQIEDELPFQLFHLTIRATSAEPDSSLFANIYSVDDGWSRLGMSFKVNWPLHTIFKPSTMEKYSHLFRFLLRVKRTQVALQRVWTILMRKQQASDLSSNLFSNVSVDATEHALAALQWQCRSHMQFFVDNLQYYFQADVLESHFTHLLNKIRIADEAHQDFESLIMAHDNFLNALMSQCFVMSSTVCSCLMEILDLCQQFCEIVVASHLVQSKEETHEQISKLWELFSKKTFVFFQVLTGVCSSQCNPHISQLTLRLDYNRHYSSLISKSKGATKKLF